MKELYKLPSGNRNTAVGIFLSAAGAVFSVILGSIWGATQYAAWKLLYAPALGSPIVSLDTGLRLHARSVGIVVAGIGVFLLATRRGRSHALGVGALALLLLALGSMPLYAPLNFFVWWWRFGSVAGTKSVWEIGAAIAAVPSHFAFVAAGLVAVRRAKRIGGKTDAHGSARWASAEEVRGSPLFGNDEGVYVGAWEDERGTVHYLRHAGPQNVLCFAPSRSGKGVGLVIPTLLSWRGSVVVNDIKGENWELTAGWRRDELGSVCLKFDPTSRRGDSARYNPLLEVRPWPEDVRDAQNIADILVDPNGEKVRDHWDLTAHDLLVGVILHVLYAEPDKSLAGCLRVLADPSRPIEDTLRAMLETEHDPEGATGWTQSSEDRPTKTHPVVSGAARALLNKSENERSSVISSAIKFLNLYRDPTVAANTRESDFAVGDLTEGEKPVSLYLAVPPSDIERTRPLVRLVLNQIGRRLTEKMVLRQGEGSAKPNRRLLLMLDEFPTLGRLPFFESALAYLPGYGIQAYLIAQDLAQLYAAYGRDESIVSNCHVRIAFAPNKIETANLLSEMAGAMTVFRETRSYTGNRLAPFLFHVIASEQESQRPLLTPDEALRLPEDASLIFEAGSPPIFGRKIRFYVDPVFAKRSAMPAPAISDRITHDWMRWTGRVRLPPPAAQVSVASAKRVAKGADLT